MTVVYHAGYVLDASVVAKWFTRHAEPDRTVAVGLRRHYLEGKFRLFIPDLCLLEVANAIRFSPKATEEHVAEALEAIRALSMEVRTADWDLLRKANAIAWAYRTTLYDALYVALAEQVGYPLLTADEQLLRNLRGHSVVLRLGDMRFDAEGGGKA